MIHISIKLFPNSRTGRLALGIFAVSIVLLLLGSNLPENLKNADLPDIIRNPLFSILMYSGMLSTVIAAFWGLRSILKEKDRALLIYITIPLGVIFSTGAIIMIVVLITQKLLGII